MKKIAILLIMILFVSSISVAGDEIKIRERELKELENELKQVDSKIKENKVAENSTLKKINTIEDNIKNCDDEISDLNLKIENTNLSIDDTKDRLNEEFQVLTNRKSVLESRVRVMYKAGKVGYIEVLLGSKDFKDLITRIDIVQNIIDHDKGLIEGIKLGIVEIEKLEAELVAYGVELERAKNEVDVNKEYLNTQFTDLQIQKIELRDNKKVLEALEDKLVDDADQITDILKNLKTKAEYVGGKMMWPVPSSYRITSEFGYRIHPIYHKKKLHTGIDIGAAWGNNVVSAQSGTVIHADWLGGYGKVIMVDHGGGYVTLYAHLSEWKVKVGDAVKKGDIIAKIGTTGVSTGPHLHFEVRLNGEYVDPVTYVKN